MSGTLSYVFGLLLFLAVVLFIEGFYVWWNDSRGPEARRIESRLRVMSAGTDVGREHVSIVKERLLAGSPIVQRALLRIPRVHQLDRLLEQSGLTWSVTQFLLLTLAVAVAGWLVAVVLRLPPVMAIPLAIAAATLPWLFVRRARSARLRQMDQQMPDALDLMSRALRAGHALPAALQMVSDEMPQPIAGEFGIAFDEVNYGIAMKDALSGLATRVPINDLRYFVIAVLIQRETGGNLAELLDNIAALIRARHKLMGTIRVLSAEGRLSATILCILPFVAAFLIYLLNRDFMATLWTDPLGVRFIAAGLILMVIGIYWSRRIIRIHV